MDIMRIDQFTFGSIRIDGETYTHDVVIDRGRVRKRRKRRSKAFSAAFGHTPLSANEEIPWKCRRLVVGTGADGSLPIMGEVKEEAARRRIELLILPTREAISGTYFSSTATVKLKTESAPVVATPPPPVTPPPPPETPPAPPPPSAPLPADALRESNRRLPARLS